MIWIGLGVGIFCTTAAFVCTLGLCKASGRADLEQEILVLKYRVYNLLLENKIIRSNLEEV